MKKVLLIISLVLLLSIPVFADDIVTINIGHTNDVHARYLYDEYGASLGLAKLKSIADDMDIMLDAGDLYSGQAFATIEQGESIAAVMNLVGYDAMTCGNHDWNYGNAQLLNLQDISGLPVLACNVIKNGESFFETEYIIKEIDGVKVGIFGVIDPVIHSVIEGKLIAGIEFGDSIEYAEMMVDKLIDQVDVIIALSHCIDFVPLSEIDGIDIVIAGHQHIVANTIENGTLMVEAGEYLENVGIITLSFDKSAGEIIDISAVITPFEELKDYESDADIEALINEIIDKQSEKLDVVLGETPVDLIADKPFVRFMETNLGRIVSDSYRYITGSDIAIENGGGIRSTIPAGTITYRSVIDVAPYGNHTIVKLVSGAGILEVIERSIDIGIQVGDVYYSEDEEKVYIEDDGQYLHFSGINVVYNRDLEYGNRILSARVNGKKLDPNEFYTVAGNSYIMNHNLYPQLRDSELVMDTIACDETIREYITSGEFENSLKGQRVYELREYVTTLLSSISKP